MRRSVPFSTTRSSAVLRYFDCNTAEMRVVLNGTDLRTLRLRRSRPIEVCVALDRND